MCLVDRSCGEGHIFLRPHGGDGGLQYLPVHPDGSQNHPAQEGYSPPAER